jgi:dihydroorotate dehydrogenase electron transfer subunit
MRAEEASRELPAEAPPAAGARTLAPPERRVAPVTSNEALGAYGLITALDAGGPPDPRPGQFYMLAAAEGWGGRGDERPYLPRAFSYARARSTADGVELSFLLEAIGPGTERLAALDAGEELALVGPLGIGFRPAAEGCRPLLVGGGIGAAPLLCLQDELDAEEGPATLLGFRSASFAEAAGLFRGPVELATDDGSAGRHALVTELLREQLEDLDGRASVFACGPPPMLEAVRMLCASHRCPAQLALESGMACGFGACFGCVVPTRAGYVRLCVEGPVLDADLLETALHE